MMKMMLRLASVSGGSLRVLGHDPAALPASVRRAIGFLPESVVFHDAMSGWEVLHFYARLKRRGAKECRGLLERVGLGEAAGRRVGTYSKGMRQRLGLAQALLGSPRLLLLDEPTSGLDTELRLSFYGIIADLARQGTAMLLSSHLLTELEERTDRIAILDRGRLVADGTLDALLAPGMAVTLNGIAQGYATDRVADLLRAHGLATVLVHLGETRITGRPEPRGAWRIALPDGRIIKLAGDAALATSSPDGTRFSPCCHYLFDPTTGRSARDAAPVTLRAPTAALADALSTAAAIAPQRAAEMIGAVPGAYTLF